MYIYIYLCLTSLFGIVKSVHANSCKESAIFPSSAFLGLGQSVSISRANSAFSLFQLCFMHELLHRIEKWHAGIGYVKVVEWDMSGQDGIGEEGAAGRISY